MSNIKFSISITLVLVILAACSSNSSEYSTKISSDNKPQHHRNNGYQNHPFVETAAPKGFFSTCEEHGARCLFLMFLMGIN